MSSRRGAYSAGMEAPGGAAGGGGSNQNHQNSSGGGTSGRKQSIINVPNASSRTQHDKTYQQGNMTVTSLKSRLAPTIQSAMSAAVDTLLGEVVLVLNETQQELMNKEQENQRLKVRLEVSERELKTLQECLCSAQKLIDQLQITYSGNPVSQSVFAPLLTSMSSMQQGDHQNNGGRGGVNGADLVGGLGGQVDPSDGLHGFESRNDDYKMCQLSIQPDGSVTSNHSMEAYNNSTAHNTAHMQTDDRQQSQGGGGGGGGGGGSRFEIKEEQGPSSGGGAAGGQQQQSVRKDNAMRGGGDSRVGVDGGGGGDNNVGGDLNYIQSGGEEGPSRSFTYPLRHPHPVRPRKDGQKQQQQQPVAVASRTSSSSSMAGRSDSVSPGRASGGLGAGGTGAGADEDSLPEGPTSDRPHHCLECGKTFRLISSLKKHIRIHTGEKPYPCGVCGRRFRESGALKTHLRIHTGEKPYSCSECGNSFRHLDGLRKHRRTHTGEKPYVCAICGKRLSRLQHLKHHQLIHTGERPCCCPFCNRSFKEPAALRKHVRTHREEAGHMGLQGGGGGGGAAGGGGGGEDTDPDGLDDINSMHPAAPSPTMRFPGEWGAEDDDGSVVDCV